MQNILTTEFSINSHKLAIEHSVTFAKAGQLCTFVVMSGMGNLMLAKNIYQDLRKILPSIEFHKIITEEDNRKLLQVIERNKGGSYLVNLTIESHSNSLVRDLETLRKKYYGEINLILVSNLASIYPSLSQNIPLVMSNLHFVKPATAEDLALLIDKLAGAFGIKISQAQSEKVHQLSGGIAGVAKSLVMLLQKQPNFDLDDLPEVIADPAVGTRLANLKRDLAAALNDKSTLQKLGLLDANGKYFSRLLEYYFALNNDSTNELTKQEQLVYEYLHAHIGEVVPKEKLITAAWNESNTDYLDWALSQTIYRLRKKLPKLNIQTKRGRGYRLTISN